MQLIIQGLIITFAMYSIIPMPRIEWQDRNMRLTLGFFPLVGIVIGCGTLFLGWLHQRWMIPGTAVSAVLLTLWPIILSGGMHMDGFADAADALGSHRDRATKLQIMKDPNAGPFAVIGCILVILLQFACWFDLIGLPAGKIYADRGNWWFQLALIPFLSRTLSGLALYLLPMARMDGLAKSFRDRVSPKVVWLLLTELLLVAAAWIWLNPLRGLVNLAVAGLVWLCFRAMAIKIFGGITGDLAGFFLIICESALLLAQVLMVSIA